MAKLKLPNDQYAERAVLGAMLISTEALVIGLGSLEIEEFYEENLEHRLVFEAMIRLSDSRSEVDVGTVYNELSNMQQIEKVGGFQFLELLSDSAIGLTGLEHYVKIIKDAYVLRKLLLELEVIKEEYGKGIEGTVPDFVASAGDKIAKIVERRRVAEFVPIGEYVERVEKELSIQRESSEDSITGISTGYSRLNYLTNGWQNENMIVVAARPSGGKTALSLNFALTAAKKTKKTVAFFSLEMSGDLLTKRLLAIESLVDLTRITTGHLNRNEQIDVASAAKRLSDLKIYIDDTPSIKMADMIAKAKKMQNSHNDLAMVVVDYIGLITSSARSESRQQEVSEYSRKLKDLARMLKVPVIILCQLSRKVDDRDNSEPIMSDLKESGQIEQDADMILLLSAKDTGKKGKKKFGSPKEGEEEVIEKPKNPDRVIIKANLVKNRNGQTGESLLLFQKKWSLFSDLTEENIEEFKELLVGEEHSLPRFKNK